MFHDLVLGCCTCVITYCLRRPPVSPVYIFCISSLIRYLSAKKTLHNYRLVSGSPYNKPLRTEAQRVSRGIALPLHDLGARWGWVVSTTPRLLPPPLQERPGTNCTGGWVGPRAGLDGCEKSRPHRDSIPGPPIGISYSNECRQMKGNQ